MGKILGPSDPHILPCRAKRYYEHCGTRLEDLIFCEKPVRPKSKPTFEALRGGQLRASNIRGPLLPILCVVLALSGCSLDESQEPMPVIDSTDAGDRSDEAPRSSKLVVWLEASSSLALENIAAQFEQDSGISVELVVKDSEALKNQVISAIQVGDGPDLFVGSHDWTGQLASAGVIASIDLGSKSNDFRQNALAAFSLDGALLGLPFGVENIALVCNTAMVPTQPASWDEVVAAGVEIAMSENLGDPYHMYFIQSSFGATLFKEDSITPYELGMAGEEGLAFADWLAMNGETFAFVDYGTTARDLGSGKLACWITGPWAVPGISESLGEEGFAIYSLPSVGGEPASPFLSATGFFMSSGSSDSVNVRRFLVDYIGTEVGQMDIFDMTGLVPAHKRVLEKVSGNHIIRGFGEAGQTAHPLPPSSVMSEIWVPWGSTQAAILLGKIDPREGWESMVEEIRNSSSIFD